MRVSVKQTVSWLLAVALVLPGAMILSQPLEAGAAETSTPADSLPAQPVKVPAGESAADFIKNPAQPEIYTLRNEYKVTRVGADAASKKEVNYQPYVATVGADATDAEKLRSTRRLRSPILQAMTSQKTVVTQSKNTISPIKELLMPQNREQNRVTLRMVSRITLCTSTCIKEHPGAFKSGTCSRT